MLTTIAQSYKKNGYYIARNILSLEMLQSTLGEMDIILVQQLNRLGFDTNITNTVEGVHEHMRALHAKDQFVYLQSLRLWSKLYSMHRLVMDENILSLSKELGINLPIFQTNPTLHVMANDLKITGGYQGVGVHQDWPALQSGLDTITTWFPFMDVDKHNFPLQLIPGSHTYGLYPGKATEHIFEVDPSYYNEKDFVSMEVNLGDVVFMSNFTLHRSGLVGDNRLRIACSARYENASEATFIEHIYPSAQKRVIERELLRPNFPTNSHLKKIYEA